MSSGDIQRGPVEWASLCVEGAERRQHRGPSLLIAPHRREGQSGLFALLDGLSDGTDQDRMRAHLHEDAVVVFQQRLYSGEEEHWLA